MNTTDIFVETLYQLSKGPFPNAVYAEARNCVLDLLGTMIGGRIWLEDRLTPYLDMMSEHDGSTVVGFKRKASMQNATLVNGMCAHVFDMDDGHRFSTVHLGSTIIPATLAVCERFYLGMEDLLRGVVIGYETGIRLGRCLQPSHRARGFHSSGTIGTVSAAMAVAAAMKFTKEEMKSALSASTSSAAGNNRMMLDSSTLKPYNIGRAGHDGITAALIAKAGFVGPDDCMESNFGWLSAMAAEYDSSGLDIMNDSKYNILGVYHKPYASCRHTHAPLDSALAIRNEDRPDPQNIKTIMVRMYNQGFKGHEFKDIPTPVSGKMSVPYCVALALAKGSAGMRDFSEENIHDPLILSLIDKIEMYSDPEMTSWVPKKRAASVEVVMNDGTRFFKQVDFAKGEPEIPMSVEEFEAKFRDLAYYGGKTEDETEELVQMVLHGCESVRTLMQKLQ